MWNQKIWVQKTVLFLLAILIYLALLPTAVQTALGTFAVGWMLSDIINNFIKE
jgi:hypothetical protein